MDKRGDGYVLKADPSVKVRQGGGGGRRGRERGPGLACARVH